MASTFSLQLIRHALFLLLTLKFPLLMIPNTFAAKQNNACDYFKKRREYKKGKSKDNLLVLLQDATDIQKSKVQKSMRAILEYKHPKKGVPCEN